MRLRSSLASIRQRWRGSICMVGEFPEFLRCFPQAGVDRLLGDVAELEWAVNVALHAADVAPLDVAEIGAVEAENQPRICFIPDPSIGLLRLEYPADVIWRAVLDCDDDALGRIDPGVRSAQHHGRTTPGRRRGRMP